MRLVATSSQVKLGDRTYQFNETFDMPDDSDLQTLAQIERLVAAGHLRHMGPTPPMATTDTGSLVPTKHLGSRRR